MNPVNRILTGAIAALSLTAAHATNVPGANGSDGALNPTVTTVIDLSLAPTGAWDSNSPVEGRGVYDPSRWAVVFHYDGVNIPAGVLIRFQNHPSRAPVVWLVNGDVTIAGTLNLNGGSVANAEPGPGGFRGATATGLGPGGAPNDANSAGHATPGLFGPSPGRAYGNAQLLPLIGGSAFPGFSGGGAILIAATGTMTINGIVQANGSYRSSGGAIRLVAEQIAGTGSVQATGGTQASPGRIRAETATTTAPTLTFNPASASAGRPADPVLIWPGENAPTARIVSAGSEAIVADPRANFGPAADALPDILTSTIPVIIETTNVPVNSVVNLRMAPINGTAVLVQATLTSGDINLARWTANITPPEGTTALQVRVEAP